MLHRSSLRVIHADALTLIASRRYRLRPSDRKSYPVQQILPEQLVPGMLDFYNNYKTAVVCSGVPGADEGLVASVMGAIADRCSMPPPAGSTTSL